MAIIIIVIRMTLCSSHSLIFLCRTCMTIYFFSSSKFSWMPSHMYVWVCVYTRSNNKRRHHKKENKFSEKIFIHFLLSYFLGLKKKAASAHFCLPLFKLSFLFIIHSSSRPIHPYHFIFIVVIDVDVCCRQCEKEEAARVILVMMRGM